MTPGEIVTALIKANEARDVDAIIALMTDDAIYENVPMSALKGHEEIRGLLGPFLGSAGACAWEVLQQVEQGDVVMNERVDRFTMGDGKDVAIRVMGVFEIRDRKIAAWRDYFDMAELTNQMS